MVDWSTWCRFPDFQAEGFPEVSIGPGVYELRHRSTGKRILVGESKTLAKRMQSLLSKSYGGRGTRNNSCKQKYVAEHLQDVEYRTCECATKAEAKVLERRLFDKHEYIFPT